MIVIDASPLALALLDDGPLGDTARELLARDTDWAAPAHLLTEVMSVVRGHVLGSTLSVTRASDAIAALTAIAVACCGRSSASSTRTLNRGSSS